MTGGGPTGMIKYGIATLLVASYAGVSAWLVAGEGEAYRKAHREALALKAAPDPSPPPVAPPPKPESSASSPPPPIDPPPAPPPPKKEAAPPPPPVVAMPATPPPAPRPSPPIDPFWLEPEQQKFWDLDKLTSSDEARLGAALNQMVRHVHPPLRVGPLPRRMEDAIQPYLKSVARKDVKYTFTVLDCEAANSFSVPGGYVYVCRGLFDWLAEDEDYALAFVLLREIAHVDLGHAVADLKEPDVKALNIPTVNLFFSIVIPGGYTEAQEYEADRWALERMLKAGRSRYEILSFLRKLEDYAGKSGFENERLKPNDEPKVAPIDNHIRTAPIPRARSRR